MGSLWATTPSAAFRRPWNRQLSGNAEPAIFQQPRAKPPGDSIQKMDGSTCESALAGPENVPLRIVSALSLQSIQVPDFMIGLDPHPIHKIHATKDSMGNTALL